MVDGRRTRWVAHDVYFLDEGLGEAMFDRFGGVGVALWHGFIAACKKNHVEGETSWSSDSEAFQVLGLPGLRLVDNDGEPFTLDEWLRLLSDHKVIRRTSRGRRLKVACTKWERWQHDARRSREAARKAASRASTDGEQSADTSPAGGLHVPDRPPTDEQDTEGTASEGQQNRRSDDENTRTEPGQPPDESLPDTDTDTESRTSLSAVTDPKVSEDARRLTRTFALAVKANGFKVPKREQKAYVDWLVDMDRLLRLGAPGGDPDPQNPGEVEKVIGYATTDGFWKANIGSPSKLREQYPKLRLRMLNGKASVRSIGTGGVADDT